MSQSFKCYIESLIAKEITAESLANSYMEKWKAERDNYFLGQDDDNLSLLLSSIFCVADMYNPMDDRDAYEFDNDQLWSEVNKLMNEYLNQ